MVIRRMADGSIQGRIAEGYSLVADSDVDQRIAQRPTLRTEAIIEEICEGLRAGLTLQQICRRRHMPHRSTVYEWRQTDKSLAERVSRARAEGCDALAEQSLAISDDTSRDSLVVDGKPVGNHAAISRDKLRIDTRLKLAAVWNHAEYGLKQQVEHSGTISLEAIVLQSIGAKEPLNVTPKPIALSKEEDAYDDLL